MQIFNALTHVEEKFYEGKADLIKTFNSEISDTFLVEELIMKAVDNLNGFNVIESLDLSYLNSLDDKEIIQEGMTFGKNYELKGNFLILSNFSVKEHEHISQMFYVGFLLEASRRFKVVLDGGLDVIKTLLLADNLRETLLMRVKSDNILVATCKKEIQINEDIINEIICEMSYTPYILYTDFTFKNSEIKFLEEYEKTSNNAKCASLMHGAFLSNKVLLDEVEFTYYMI